MPFIYLPEINLKVLIDSGASNSVINYGPAIQYFSKNYFTKPFCVSGLGSKIFSNDNVYAPLLQELGISDEIHFHVVDWHDKFDALLGSADLQKFGAKIDYSKNILIINNVEIPFFMEYTSKSINTLSVKTKSSIKVPVSIESGEVLLPEIKINESITIPESVHMVQNGFCTMPCETDDDLEIKFSERIEVFPLFEFQISDPPSEKPPSNHLNSIRTNHLNAEEKNAVFKLCKNFKDIFYNDKCDLSFSNTVKHKIRTKDDEYVYVKPFRHPYAMRNEIQSQIQKLLDNKIIRPSISPYSSPVWIVPKKMDASGVKKFRMVIDYRKLNEKTIEDKYPLPKIEEILDNLGKCCYFTTLDLAQGFHQIEMHPESIEKTAFTVNNGHYEYVRMPFGLKNAPSTFQRVMDNVLKEYLNEFCLVYMDDVIVFSKSLQEHINHLRLVFQKLRHYNLKVQLDKTEFCSKNVEFLGHVVTPEGVKPNPSKLKAVEQYPLPQTTKQIKSFLGLIGYYRRFINNFAKVVAPITKCLKKGAKINVNDSEYIAAFNLCKDLLTNAPILAYPDFTKPFKLTTDASNVALGSVLSQGNRPVAFYSRTLNSAEKNYSTIEKELLAIVESTKHFRPYLYGRHFVVETDHNPIVWLDNIKEPNSRLYRWKIKLGDFDYTTVYKPGKENKVADALSRVEIHNKETSATTDDDNASILPVIDDLPVITDEDVMNILNSQNEEYPLLGMEDHPDETEIENDTLATQHSTQEDNGKVLPISEQPVNNFNNRLIIKSGEEYKCILKRVFNKNTYVVTINTFSIKNDLLKCVREIFKPNEAYGIFFIDNDLRKPFTDLCKSIFNYSIKLVICNSFCKDVTDKESQDEIVSDYHDTNHNGINETYNHLKLKYYWPNMKGSITNIVNSCDICLQTKYERHPYKLKLAGPLLAKRPFDVIHLDTFSFQNSKFLTIIDLFSRYAQGYLLENGTGVAILNKLRHFFAHHNVPNKIVCDEGREFQNRTFNEFCKLHKVELHFTTVNNPSSNSPIERFHSTILEKLRIMRMKNPNESPGNLMISAVLIYNQSIHSSTGFSPFHLLYGPYERNIDFDLDLTIYEQYNEKRKNEILPFYDHVYTKNKDKAQRILDNHNKNCDDPPLVENQEIYVRRNKPRKTDPIFDKINVVEQQQGKIFGITEKARQTTAHLKKAKKLRKTVSPLQDSTADTDDNPSDLSTPGPSGHQS